MSEPTPVFFERQQPLYVAIAEELIGLTPDQWNSVLLTVSAGERDGIQSMSHEISSPEGHREPIVPSQELCMLTRQLFLLFEEFGQHPWNQARYEANQNADGDWSFKCNFAYE